MEARSIRNHANNHFEQASSFRRSMEDLRTQIKLAKAEQKLHAARGIQLVINSSINSNPSQHPHTAEVAREFNEARRLTAAAKERENRRRSLDHKVQSATMKAHVLIDLARRASVGGVYAKHQADIMLGRQFPL